MLPPAIFEQGLLDGPGERASGKGRGQAHLEKRRWYGEAGRPFGLRGSPAYTHQNHLIPGPAPASGWSLRIRISSKSPDATAADTAEGHLPR